MKEWTKLFVIGTLEWRLFSNSRELFVKSMVCFIGKCPELQIYWMSIIILLWIEAECTLTNGASPSPTRTRIAHCSHYTTKRLRLLIILKSLLYSYVWNYRGTWIKIFSEEMFCVIERTPVKNIGSFFLLPCDNLIIFRRYGYTLLNFVLLESKYSKSELTLNCHIL